MSELSPAAYAYEPELPPPVFEGVPLPVREFQVLSVINDSLFMRSDSLPAALGPELKSGSIEDAVREFEKSEEPADVKNGRLLGLIAAMTEDALNGSTLQKWQLAPHIGMLNAIGAALSAGLIVSEDALRLAAGFYQEYSGSDAKTMDGSYVSPGPDSAVRAIKRTMSNYGGMDLIRDEKGIEKYVSYYTYDIDKALYDLPPSPAVLQSYEADDDARHMLEAYGYIVAEVQATRVAVIDREAELKEHLDQVYERIASFQDGQEARMAELGTQEELPGL